MASDGEYVRWVNSKEPGSLMFVTTTILGYTPALRNDAEKTRVLDLLAQACRYHQAVLHAYCIMDHHIHIVVRAPREMAMSTFMQSFKRHSAQALLGAASPWIRRRLKETGKDGWAFGMRSFRGIPIRSETVFWKCIAYVHLNPVRAGLCACAHDYVWSSARHFEACRWNEDEGVMSAIFPTTVS